MDKTFDVVGAITYWTLTERTNMDVLKTELETDDLERFLPLPRTPLDSLKHAAEGIYPDCMIRPLENSKGLAVVKENLGQTENAYKHIDTVTYDPVASANGHTDSLVSGYTRWSNLIPSNHVTSKLVEAIRAFGGHRLRDTGGIYWMPKWALGRWGLIREALRKAGGSEIYLVTTRADADSVASIIDGLKENVRSELEVIGDDFTEEKIGERGKANRLEKLTDMRAKLRRVEGLLNVGLGDLATDIDRCETLASMATLLEAAAAVPVVAKEGAA